MKKITLISAFEQLRSLSPLSSGIVYNRSVTHPYATRRSLPLTLAALAVIVYACAPAEPPPPTPTDTPAFITATLPPTLTPRPSPTVAPPTATPPVQPVEGQTTAQLNVRSAPSAASDTLGMVNIFEKVQIVGKDTSESWWMILFPESPNGVGWITSGFVQVSGVPDVPVIGAAGAAAPPAGQDASATVIESVNVRDGPGTAFNPIGTVQAGQQVTLTGKDALGTWLQIAFPSGPGGAGWISAAFLQAQGVENLPIISESGQVVGTGTPAPDTAGPAATVLPAVPDNDSAADPATNLSLSPVELRSFEYSSDLSSPQGDPEDWLVFRIGGASGQPANISVVLTCSGNSKLHLELLQGTSQLGSWQDLPCGQASQLLLSLFSGPPYTLHLLPAQSGGGLSYVNYTVTVTLR